MANSGESEAAAAVPQMPLCASCDRCRSRKTKCDGERPCSNCAQKYMKRHKVKRYVFFRMNAASFQGATSRSVATPTNKTRIDPLLSPSLVS